MLSPRRWLIIGLLASATSSCDATARYMSGMDDPQYFSWEKGETAAHPMRERASGTTPERRERFGGMALGSDSTPEAIEQPKPAAATTSSPTTAQDLRDCEAPSLRATSTAAGASPSVPTIERSEKSPAVAECMVEKGYRKVYKTRTDMF